MWVCVECGELFEEPEHYVEKHNLDSPPYEEWDGCPECAGTFVEAFRCDCCDEFITGDYFEIENGKKYCQECCRSYELKDNI